MTPEGFITVGAVIIAVVFLVIRTKGRRKHRGCISCPFADCCGSAERRD